MTHKPRFYKIKPLKKHGNDSPAGRRISEPVVMRGNSKLAATMPTGDASADVGSLVTTDDAENRNL